VAASEVPLHLARSAVVIGSSFGGFSLGGSLGAKFLGSSTWPVPAPGASAIVLSVETT